MHIKSVSGSVSQKMCFFLEMAHLGGVYEVPVVKCALWEHIKHPDNIFFDVNDLSELPGTYKMQNFRTVFNFCLFQP